jgi:phosphate transport system protein
MGSHVQTMVRAALDTWATLDREQGLAVRAMDDRVDADYQKLFHSLSTLVQQGAGDGNGSVPLYLVLVCRYLERIADHAVSAAEQAAYAAPSTTRR